MSLNLSSDEKPDADMDATLADVLAFHAVAGSQAGVVRYQRTPRNEVADRRAPPSPFLLAPLRAESVIAHFQDFKKEILFENWLLYIGRIRP